MAVRPKKKKPKATINGPTTKRKPKKKTPVARPKPKPVGTDPLAPLTLEDMQSQSMQTATSQLTPQLDAIRQRRDRESRANATRQAQLQQWQTAQQGTLDKAFQDTNAALNNLIATSAGGDQAAQSALAAALQRGQQTQAGMEQMIGGSGGPGQEDAILAAAAAQRASGDQALTQQSMSMLGAQGERRSLASITGGQNMDSERRRFNSVLQELADQETDVTARAPDLARQSMQDLRTFELAKRQFGEDVAGRKFQEWLAEQELGLKKKGQTFQEWLAKEELQISDRQTGVSERQVGLAERQFDHDRKIDWERVGIDRMTALAQVEGLREEARKEKDKGRKEKLERRAKMYQKGYELLSGIMAPRKNESTEGMATRYPAAQGTPDNPNTSENEAQPGYTRRFDRVLRQMTSQGIPMDVALNILRKSEYPDWQKRASDQYNRLKRKGPHSKNPRLPG